MPRGDGTGPMGAGPMTGRAAGYCAGYDVPGYMNPAGGRGMGMRRGHGFGRGFGRFAPAAYPVAPPQAQYFVQTPEPPPYDRGVAPAVELANLKGQAEYMARTLETINERITALEAASADDGSD